MFPLENEELEPAKQVTVDASLVQAACEQLRKYALPAGADDQVLLNLESALGHNYHRDPCFEQGHWFIRDEDGALFIVPDDRHGTAETHGPDDETLQALNAIYREAEDASTPGWFDKMDLKAICEKLELTFAENWQRRFDPFVGWYTV